MLKENKQNIWKIVGIAALAVFISQLHRFFSPEQTTALLIVKWVQIGFGIIGIIGLVVTGLIIFYMQYSNRSLVKYEEKKEPTVADMRQALLIAMNGMRLILIVVASACLATYLKPEIASGMLLAGLAAIWYTWRITKRINRIKKEANG